MAATTFVVGLVAGLVVIYNQVQAWPQTAVYHSITILIKCQNIMGDLWCYAKKHNIMSGVSTCYTSSFVIDNGFKLKLV